MVSRIRVNWVGEKLSDRQPAFPKRGDAPGYEPFLRGSHADFGFLDTAGLRSELLLRPTNSDSLLRSTQNSLVQQRSNGQCILDDGAILGVQTALETQTTRSI